MLTLFRRGTDLEGRRELRGILEVGDVRFEVGIEGGNRRSLPHVAGKGNSLRQILPRKRDGKARTRRVQRVHLPSALNLRIDQDLEAPTRRDFKIGSASGRERGWAT